MTEREERMAVYEKFINETYPGDDYYAVRVVKMCRYAEHEDTIDALMWTAEKLKEEFLLLNSDGFMKTRSSYIADCVRQMENFSESLKNRRLLYGDVKHTLFELNKYAKLEDV